MARECASMQEKTHAADLSDSANSDVDSVGVRLDSGRYGEVGCHRNRLRSFLHWLARIPYRRSSEVYERYVGPTLRQLEGFVATTDTAVLSDGQNLSGKGQEICGNGNRTTGKADSRIQQGRIDIMPFLHLGVRYEDPEAPKTKAIEEVLNRAKDWYRYAPNCWIIYTGKDAKTWGERLRRIPAMEDHASFLICEMPLEQKDKRDGWLPEAVWKWINKER